MGESAAHRRRGWGRTLFVVPLLVMAACAAEVDGAASHGSESLDETSRGLDAPAETRVARAITTTASAGDQAAEARAADALRRLTEALRAGDSQPIDQATEDLAAEGDAGLRLLLDAITVDDPGPELALVAIDRFGAEGCLAMAERLTTAPAEQAVVFALALARRRTRAWRCSPAETQVARQLARSIGRVDEFVALRPEGDTEAEWRESWYTILLQAVGPFPRLAPVVVPELAPLLATAIDDDPQLVRATLLHSSPWRWRASGLLAPLLPRWNDLDREAQMNALWLVEAIGPTAPPEVVERIRTSLRSEDEGLRGQALAAAWSLGANAAPLAPELGGRLDDSARLHAEIAAVALCRVGAPPLDRMETVLSAWTRLAGVKWATASQARGWLYGALREHGAAWADDLRRAFPRATTDEAIAMAELLARLGVVPGEVLAGDLLALGDATACQSACDLLTSRPLDDARTAVLYDLLASDAAAARYAAAKALLVHAPAARPAAVRALRALAAETSGEVAARSRWLVECVDSGYDATPQLLNLLESDPDAWDWDDVVGDLDTGTTGPLPALPPWHRDAMLVELCDGDTWQRVLDGRLPAFVRVLARSAGGREALERALDTALGLARPLTSIRELPTILTVHPDWGDGNRERLLAAAADATGEDERVVARAVRAHFARRDGDLDEFVESIDDAEVAVPFLLSCGDSGLRALLRLGGRVDLSEAAEVPAPHAALGRVMRAALDDESGTALRLGSARLVDRVPTDQFEALAPSLLEDREPDVRRAAAAAVGRWCSAGRPLSGDVLRVALRRAVSAEVVLASGGGRRSDGSVDALLERWMDEGGPSLRILAARAWLASGSPAARAERAAVVVRDALARAAEEGEWGSGSPELPWSDVSDVVLAHGPAREDVELLADPALRGGWDVRHDLLRRLGPDALPALPLLTERLARTYSRKGIELEEAALAAIGAIGPAAAAAEPDIRGWMSVTGDPDGIGVATLRAIAGD